MVMVAECRTPGIAVIGAVPIPTPPVVPPVVTLGGVNLPIEYAGLAPGQVGVYQINAIVPFKGVPTGPIIPLKIEQSTFSTSVNVRVVQH